MKVSIVNTLVFVCVSVREKRGKGTLRRESSLTFNNRRIKVNNNKLGSTVQNEFTYILYTYQKIE